MYRGSISGKPGLPDTESDVGGYESYPTTSRAAAWDSDHDGLPDWWETVRGLNPASAANVYSDSNSDRDGNGFTELDEYLEWMAKPHYFTSVGQNVAIDLGQAFVGYTASPTYTASNAVGGAITVSGRTATFTSSACGLASFRVAVRDGAGATMTKDMVVFVDNGSGTCP